MKLRNHYQWIVIGDHPGALLSAGLAARLGISVLIVPISEPDASGLVVSADGRVHDSESSWVSSLGVLPTESGLSRQGLLGATLYYLGATPREFSSLVLNDLESQVLAEGQHFSLSKLLPRWHEQFRWLVDPKRPQFAQSVEDSLRVSEEVFLDFWMQLPDRLTWQNITAVSDAQKVEQKKLAEGEIKSPEVELVRRFLLREESMTSGERKRVSYREFRKLLQSPMALSLERLGGLALADLARSFPLLSGVQSSNEMSYFDWLHCSLMARHGARVSGGRQKLRQFLIRLAIRNGADYIADRDARRVFLQGERFSGVQVSGSGTVITADGGVYGARMGSLMNRLVGVESRRLQRKFSRSQFRADPRALLFTLSLNLSEAGALGLPSRLVIASREGRSIEIERVAPNHYASERKREAWVHLRTSIPLPEGPALLDAENILQQAARMERRLEEVFPGVGKHVLSRFPDHTDLRRGVRDIEQIYPHRSRADVPGYQVGAWSHPLSSATPMKNLFLVSHETYAQLGDFGPWVGAFESVAWIAHQSGISGPLVGARGTLMSPEFHL